MAEFRTITAIAAAEASGIPISLPEMAVGDGNPVISLGTYVVA